MADNAVEGQEQPRKRRWVPRAAWAAGTLVAFVFGVGVGASGETTPSDSAGPSPAATVTVTAEPEIGETEPSEELLTELADREAALDEREAELAERESELDERETAIADEELAIEEGTIPGTGIFVVGEDIQPGTYRGDGSGGTCYWARLSGTSGDFDELIANGLPEGPTVVTINESDVAFETQGCADWVRQ